MEMNVRGCLSRSSRDDQTKEEMKCERKGPWIDEEDSILFNYVRTHGEGRWNSVARCSGLKRTGKSCRLRWLNYLRPTLRHGNITLQEQLLILHLYFRWGNRWSKIAQFLPGRTDNEIKNYWRTRVHKQAKQLNCDVNSKQFRDAMRYVWMPRMLERIQAKPTESNFPSVQTVVTNYPASTDSTIMTHETSLINPTQKPWSGWMGPEVQAVSSINSNLTNQWNDPNEEEGFFVNGSDYNELGLVEQSSDGNQVLNSWFGGGDDDNSLDGFWNEEELWFFEQQLGDGRRV